MAEPTVPGTGVPGDEQFLSATRRTLLGRLEALPALQRPWSVVDFPMHFNCGDSAIWLGQQSVARHLRTPVTRVLDRSSYSRDLVDPDSTIVIQGGGNWGGLYRTHHRLRLRVLREMRQQPVVQMPQSIEYVDEQAREDLRRAVGEHPDVVLLVRDQRSLALARRDYDCRVELVPDAAFALGSLEHSAPRHPLVVQKRTDKEAQDDQVFTGPSFDWLTPPPRSASRGWLTLAVKVNALQRRVGGQVPARASAVATNRLAVSNLRRGVALLAAGEMVVTDRLHGHVMCTLLRIPHVVVNDAFGKVEALYSTWTHADPISRLSPSWAEADRLVDELRAETSR